MNNTLLRGAFQAVFVLFFICQGCSSRSPAPAAATVVAAPVGAATMSARDYDAYFRVHAIHPTGRYAVATGPAVVRPVPGTMVLEIVFPPRPELDFASGDLVSRTFLEVTSVVRRDGQSIKPPRANADLFLLHKRTPADTALSDVPWFEWPRENAVLQGIRPFFFDPPTPFGEMAVLIGFLDIELPLNTAFIELPTDGRTVAHGDRTARAAVNGAGELLLEVNGPHAQLFAGAWVYSADGELTELVVTLERADQHAVRMAIRHSSDTCARLVIGLPDDTYRRRYEFNIDMTKLP